MQWVENSVRDLAVSYPEDGIFYFDCAELAKTHLDKFYKMMNVFVFCVEVNRVGNFIDGERERGLCRLLRTKFYRDQRQQEVGGYYKCYFLGKRKTVHQAKAADAPSPETTQRRSAIVHGQSKKIGCRYTMHWRGFTRRDKTYAAVFVANGAQHVRKGETEAVHGPGCASLHLLFLTPGCKNYVRQLVIQGLTRSRS
jgi:hypothetical protein